MHTPARAVLFLLMVAGIATMPLLLIGQAGPAKLEARKMPVKKGLLEEQLLELVQRQTFRYFWDFAHPVSGLARERSNPGPNYFEGLDVVTTGGSGFGLMAIIVATERGWITREQALERLLKTVNFLLQRADHYHGIFPHWLDGATGRTIRFSRNDDGADLVETSFLFQGLLTVREYFDRDSPQEKELRNKITRLWNEAEWNWFTRGGIDVLYWHWSPNHGWKMNHEIRGWNECLITYLLAAAAPNFSIEAQVYHRGWARGPAFRNGRPYYGITLPLGPEYGGPLFFTHYSFLGLDPRGLRDRYADYWEQNKAHVSINYEHCVRNPKGNKGYGPNCWGLTASDNHRGYGAHSPANDIGVITPTAALSSFPYAPEQAMRALRYFYERLGDRIWTDFGFVDAFNETENWYSDGFLAIDQGPIVVMIENFRSGLLWNLFMRSPDIRRGLQRLGFESPHLKD